MKYIYLLYDERYYGEPNKATVLNIFETLKEAKEDKKDFGHGVIVKCRDQNGLLKDHEIVG